LKQLQTEAADIDFAAAIASGSAPDISFDVPELNLDTPLAQIESNVNKLVGTSALLPDVQREAAKKAASEFKSQSKFIKGIETGVLNLPKESIQEKGFSSTSLLKELGLGDSIEEQDQTLSGIFKGSAEQVEKFKKELSEAAKSGEIITPEEAEKILAPLKEATQKNAEILTTTTQAANAALAKNAAQIRAESEARTRGLEALNNYNKVVSDGAALVAKLEGGSEKRSRFASNRTAAQQALDIGQQSRGGTKLNANDNIQLSNAKKSALIERKTLAARVIALKNSGKNATELANSQKRLAQLNNTIKDADAALSSFGDAIGLQISVLEEELSKAGESRKQAFAVLSEFVLGGQDTRENLDAGARGISAVVQTGTIQNQSEEQRGLTVSLLDKLKDVQIGNTGLTGGQIKQEVVFRDAVRLGFPPEIAKELATSTTIEQQMLDEIKKLVALQAKQAGIDLAAANFSDGGQVQYRAGGGSIFKPKGTDTVPAMLTPGEFVIKKSAVDKIGAGNLAALNNGGGPIYRAKGGPVGINAGNAVTAGNNGGIITFPSSEQFLSVARLAVSSKGKGGFLKTLESGNNISKGDIKAIKLLINTNKFDPLRFLNGVLAKDNIFEDISETRASLFDNFESISPSGSTLKNGKNDRDAARSANLLFGISRKLRNNPIGGFLSSELADLVQLNRQAVFASEKFKKEGKRNVGSSSLVKATNDPVTNKNDRFDYFDQRTKKAVELSKKLPPSVVGFDKNRSKRYKSRDGSKSEGRYGDLRYTGGATLTFLGPGDKFNPIKKSTGDKSVDARKQRLSGSNQRIENAILQLKQQGLYLAQGGSASGSSADRIPAMLTPGEFVMRPEAVRTHGVGLMKQLNRGQATGFRTGGLVGSGAVAYRQNGSSGAESSGSSSLSIDSSSLQSVLSEFSASFSSSLDNMVAEFSNMSASMTNLASAITGGMVVNHQFSGDMSLAFKLENADTLKTAISDAMTPVIVDTITTEINRRLDTKDFKSQ
jgi:hypothetical protein